MTTIINESTDLFNKSIKSVSDGYDMGIKIRQQILSERMISQVFSFFSIVTISSLKKTLEEMKLKKKYIKLKKKNNKNLNNDDHRDCLEKFEDILISNEQIFSFALQLECGYKVGDSGKIVKSYKYIIGFLEKSNDLSIYLNENGIIENLKTYTTILRDRISESYVKSFWKWNKSWNKKKTLEMKGYIEEIVINQIFFQLGNLNPYDPSLFKFISKTNEIKSNKNSKLQKDILVFQFIQLDSNNIKFQKIFNSIISSIKLNLQRSDNSINLQNLMNNLYYNNLSGLTNNSSENKEIINLSPLIINNINSTISNGDIENIQISKDGASTSLTSPPQTPVVIPQSNKSNDSSTSNNIANETSTIEMLKKLNKANNNNGNIQPNIVIISRPFKISKLNKIHFIQEEHDIKMLDGNILKGNEDINFPKLIKEFLLNYSMLAKSADEWIQKKNILPFQMVLLNELNETIDSNIDFKQLLLSTYGKSNILELIDNSLINSISKPIIEDALNVLIIQNSNDSDDLNQIKQSINNIIKEKFLLSFELIEKDLQIQQSQQPQLQQQQITNHNSMIATKIPSQQQQQFNGKELLKLSILTNVLPVFIDFSKYLCYILKNIV